MGCSMDHVRKYLNVLWAGRKMDLTLTTLLLQNAIPVKSGASEMRMAVVAHTLAHF